MAQGRSSLCAHTRYTTHARGVHAENIGAIVTPDEYLNVLNRYKALLYRNVCDVFRLPFISPVCLRSIYLV